MFEITIRNTRTNEVVQMSGDAVFAVTNNNADNNGHGFVDGAASFNAAVAMLVNMVGVVEETGAAPKGAIALATAQRITEAHLPNGDADIRRIMASANR